MSNVRVLVTSLMLSASALIGLVVSEGYTERAVIPTQGDRPTVGFGSTIHADGSPVKMGDTVSPVKALATVQAHIVKEEQVFKESLPGVELNQVEYDTYMDFVYQYGSVAWTGSSMRRHLLAGNHAQACDALLLWKKAAGYDCSTLVDGQPNKRCWGVWERQLARHKKCMEAQ